MDGEMEVVGTSGSSKERRTSTPEDRDFLTSLGQVRIVEVLRSWEAKPEEEWPRGAAGGRERPE